MRRIQWRQLGRDTTALVVAVIVFLGLLALASVVIEAGLLAEQALS